MKILSQTNGNYTNISGKINNPNFKKVRVEGDRNLVYKSIAEISHNKEEVMQLERFLYEFKDVPYITYVLNGISKTRDCINNRIIPRVWVEIDHDVNSSTGIDYSGGKGRKSIFSYDGYAILPSAQAYAHHHYFDDSGKTRLSFNKSATLNPNYHGGMAEARFIEYSDSFIVGYNDNDEKVAQQVNIINDAPNVYLKNAKLAEIMKEHVDIWQKQKPHKTEKQLQDEIKTSQNEDYINNSEVFKNI